MIRVHFKKVPKSKTSKLSQKSKVNEENVAVMPQLNHLADSLQVSQKGARRIPPTQTPAARAAVHKSSALEELVSDQSPSPSQSLPWRRAAASAAPTVAREESTPRELGRVVCWKDTGYGFVVNEAGERLFVRQAEVEGGEELRAGQLIRFSRGKSQAGQAAKALKVTIVSQEEARVMRQSVSMQSASSSKALALRSTPVKEVAVATTPAVQDSGCVLKDDDLSAFLGVGSKEEQMNNLKYAPQWVVDKFWAQHAQHHQEL
eukprot:gnl/TRDRNA2_/TRDRNA2_175793_c1_seq36.p1 gnl/TRDRNA2_/TRDRNA2_175793_c1~~gnl/TRDRNA2_/TRDRNA2_175793_c1_seq36.p1  ORF type:complete len:270 (-),score=52.43 gnl/TRDRNA2_/TRDRNA2_175793_c1_seq36:58-840(-)